VTAGAERVGGAQTPSQKLQIIKKWRIDAMQIRLIFVYEKTQKDILRASRFQKWRINSLQPYIAKRNELLLY
jgi:hypothetical protein